MTANMLVVALICLGSFSEGRAQQHENNGTPALEADVLVLSGRFPTLVPYHVASEEHLFAFVFANTQGTIHHVLSDSTGLRENWRSFPVGEVNQLFVEDLDRDGRKEIIALSREARPYVWDTSACFASESVGVWRDRCLRS